jgi:hypothetical protein
LANQRGKFPGFFGAATPTRPPSSPGATTGSSTPARGAWFRESATELLALAAGYLRLLDRYDVPWMELRTSSPGRIVYADEVQVVAVPFGYPEGWPFDGLALPAMSRGARSSPATGRGETTTRTE